MCLMRTHGDASILGDEHGLRELQHEVAQQGDSLEKGAGPEVIIARYLVIDYRFFLQKNQFF